MAEAKRKRPSVRGRRKATAKKPAAAKPKAAAKASKSSASAKAPAAKKKPAPNMQERMEGLQGWMAEIERKQERTTKIGGAAAILAVLASGGALALGILNKQDAATNDDLEQLTEQVNELGASVKDQTEKQLKSLNSRISGLEQRLGAVETQQQQNATQLQTLQTQVNQAAASGAGRGAGAGAGLGGAGGGAGAGQP